MFSEELLKQVTQDQESEFQANRRAGLDPYAAEESAMKTAFAKPDHMIQWTALAMRYGMANLFPSMLTHAFILGRRYAEAEALEAVSKQCLG